MVPGLILNNSAKTTQPTRDFVAPQLYCFGITQIIESITFDDFDFVAAEVKNFKSRKSIEGVWLNFLDGIIPEKKWVFLSLFLSSFSIAFFLEL